MAQSADIAVLKKKRTSIKSACTRLRTYTNSLLELSELDADIIANLEERKEQLSKLWKNYSDVQSAIELLCEDEERDRDAFEEMFFALSATMRRMIADSKPADPTVRAAMSAGGTVSSGVVSAASGLRLPKLELPKFTGKYEEWFPFYEMFNSVINQSSALNDFQRLQYLRASIAGEAAAVIESLELSEHNYQVAWNLLKQRYDNRRVIVQTHLRALFEMPSIAKEGAVELRRVADSVAKHVQALKALRCPIEHWDDMLIYLVSSKFDSLTAKEWQSTLSGAEMPNYEHLSQFLSRRCQLLESISRSSSVQCPGRRLAAHAAAVVALSCSYCRGSHLIYYCRDFLKLSPVGRLAEARKRKLCTNCLRDGTHSSKNCKSGACKVCGIKHNSLLHLAPNSDASSEKTNTADSASRNLKTASAVVAHSSVARDSHVLLSTALVYVVDAKGIKQPCRVLLDCGSQANFITRACVGRLNLRVVASNVRIAGINGMISRASESVEIGVRSRLNEFTANLECIVTDRITERLPASAVNKDSIRLPRNIKLADPEFDKCSDIDVLIGVDLFWRLLCIGTIRSSSSQPTLQKTHFGWVVAGRVGHEIRAREREVKLFHARIVDDADLHDRLEQFWRVEESYRPRDSYSAVERICEQHFRSNTIRDSRGRFVVALPVDEEKLRAIGDTRGIALRRLYSLERRLGRDSSLSASYREFIHEYLSLGHMRLVADGREVEGDHPICYLPHHCVLRPSSETTKLRVVFDT